MKIAWDFLVKWKNTIHELFLKITQQPFVVSALNEWQTRWQGWSMRERIGVAGGSSFVLLCLLYSIVWAPLTGAVSYYRNEVMANQVMLAQMKEAGSQIKALRGQVSTHTVRDQAALLSIVEKLVRKSRIQKAVSEMSLGLQNTVRMRFEDVNFDDLISWLIELAQKEGIVVDTFGLEKLPETGHVKVQMTIMAI